MENLTYGKKCNQNAPFSGKNLKNFLGRGHSPLTRPYPHLEANTLTRPLTLCIYLCTYFFVFLGGHCTYKSSHGKALIWSGNVMEIDFSKVVGTMVPFLGTGKAAAVAEMLQFDGFTQLVCLRLSAACCLFSLSLGIF